MCLSGGQTRRKYIAQQCGAWRLFMRRTTCFATAHSEPSTIAITHLRCKFRHSNQPCAASNVADLLNSTAQKIDNPTYTKVHVREATSERVGTRLAQVYGEELRRRDRFVRTPLRRGWVSKIYPSPRQEKNIFKNRRLPCNQITPCRIEVRLSANVVAPSRFGHPLARHMLGVRRPR